MQRGRQKISSYSEEMAANSLDLVSCQRDSVCRLWSDHKSTIQLVSRLIVQQLKKTIQTVISERRKSQHLWCCGCTTVTMTWVICIMISVNVLSSGILERHMLPLRQPLFLESQRICRQKNASFCSSTTAWLRRHIVCSPDLSTTDN